MIFIVLYTILKSDGHSVYMFSKTIAVVYVHVTLQQHIHTTEFFFYVATIILSNLALRHLTASPDSQDASFGKTEQERERQKERKRVREMGGGFHI